MVRDNGVDTKIEANGLSARVGAIAEYRNSDRNAGLKCLAGGSGGAVLQS